MAISSGREISITPYFRRRKKGLAPFMPGCRLLERPRMSIPDARARFQLRRCVTEVYRPTIRQFDGHYLCVVGNFVGIFLLPIFIQVTKSCRRTDVSNFLKLRSFASEFLQLASYLRPLSGLEPLVLFEGRKSWIGSISRKGRFVTLVVTLPRKRYI